MNRFVKVLLGAVVLGAGSAGLWLNGATAVAADEPPSPVTLKGDMRSVHSVAFSPDGKTLASGSADATIKLWDVGTEIRRVGPAAVPVPAVPAAPSPTLSDMFPGCTVEFEGTKVFLRDASGYRKPMPDGDYVLNGVSLHIRGGVKLSQK